MENSPEQDEAKTVLHEDSIRDPASPQEQNIIDPVIIESPDSPTGMPATTENIEQEDIDYTQSNADFPHEPASEFDDDLKDLSSVPVTTFNIKQESLDHTQSGAYSPYELVPKLERGLAVSIDMLEGVQDFPGQMSSMPSQKHEDIKASLDDTIECS
ncbi:hypothetical protein LTR06_011575, partial [Exophiala xenobiotica]